MNNVKQFLLMLILGSILISNHLIVNAEESSGIVSAYVYDDIVGVYRQNKENGGIVESSEDMNYVLDTLDIKFCDSFVELNTIINNKEISIKSLLYSAQLGKNAENKIIGVENENTSEEYGILKLIIEKDADESTLLVPNMYLKGQTVLSLALYNKYTGEQYYFQIPLENFDFENIYIKAMENFSISNTTKEEIFTLELAYFSMQPINDFQDTISSEGEIVFENAGVKGMIDDSSVLEENGNTIEDLEGNNTYDEIMESENDSVASSTPLIPNIPNSQYKIKQHGTWTYNNTGYVKNGNTSNLVGYVIYHMYDFYSGNALNYVLRYYTITRFNWLSNEFENSFNLSHNLWVEYIKSYNKSYIFDDKPTHARILISPEVQLRVIAKKSKNGYFVSKQTNARKTGGIAPKLAKIIIGYTPYLSDVHNIYTTLTEDVYKGNDSKVWFDPSYNYTRSVKVKMNNLKRAGNNNNYVYDYIGLTVWGNNVKSIEYSFKYTCRIK